MNPKISEKLEGMPRAKLAQKYSPFLMHLLGYDVEWFHYEWIDMIVTYKNIIILAPRGHGKSIAMACYVIQRILDNPNIRILVVSNTSKQSTEFMGIVKSWFEHPDFVKYFGDYSNKNVKWTTSEMIVKGRTKVMRESTLSASSYGGAIISRHVDLLIIDDIEDEENSRTKAQRELLEIWFNKTLGPVPEPWAKTVVVGTRWHYEDLYGGLLVAPDWKSKIYRTPEDPEYDDRGILCGGKPLWEKRWSIPILRERFQKMGSINYNSQYFNDPSGMKGAIFQFDWFKWYDELPAGYKWRCYLGVDPAISLKDEACEFAMIDIRVNEVGDIYINEEYGAHIPIQKQVDKIYEWTRLKRPFIVGIETNAYQKALAQLCEGLNIPVQEFPVETDKVTRAIRIQPYLQNGRIFVRKSMKETLVKQMLQVPHTDLYDRVDALGLAIESSLGGTYIIKETNKEEFNRETVGVKFFDLGEGVEGEAKW